MQRNNMANVLPTHDIKTIVVSQAKMKIRTFPRLHQVKIKSAR